MSFCFLAMLSAGAGAAADAAPAFHLPVKLAFVANFICGLLHQNQLRQNEEDNYNSSWSRNEEKKIRKKSAALYQW